MSRYSVMVVGENVVEQLAPYQENNMGDCPKHYLKFVEDEEYDVDADTGKRGYWHNPNSKWDWYVEGGRWSGHFTLKDGSKADSGNKGDIAWEKMRDEVGDRAAKRYDFAMTFLGNLPENETWEEVRAEHEKVEDARTAYWNQPRCREWAQATRDRYKECDEHGISTFFDSPDQFLVSRKQYITAARNRAGSTFAVLKGGKWYERGQMMMFGIAKDEKDEETWVSMFSKMVDELPGDAMLTVVDCHI